MYEIWYDSQATDEEISNCQGDYIGCEICRNQKRCVKLMLDRLNNIQKESVINEN